MDPSKRMYYNVEKYLTTGNEECHEYIKTNASDARAFAKTYNQGTEIFAGNGWLASFFWSYVLADPSKTDPATVKIFTDIVKETADTQCSYLDENAYPLATQSTLSWWGSNVAQGQYAYPIVLMWKLTGEQHYIDVVSQMMDYALGLNPLGKCFMTGVGFNRVKNPHDRESAYTIEQGWGPRPGILIFGPGLATNNGKSYPEITSRRRRTNGVPTGPSGGPRPQGQGAPAGPGAPQGAPAAAPGAPAGAPQGAPQFTPEQLAQFQAMMAQMNQPEDPNAKYTPRERIYIDCLDAISQSEYTIYQSLCFPAVIYPILAGHTQFEGFGDPYAE